MLVLGSPFPPHPSPLPLGTAGAVPWCWQLVRGAGKPARALSRGVCAAAAELGELLGPAGTCWVPLGLHLPPQAVSRGPREVSPLT